MKRNILALLGIVLAAVSQARDVYNFNSGWILGKDKNVTLPHSWNEDEAFKVNIAKMSDSVIWYRKTFTMPVPVEGKKVFIEFEGARQAAKVYVNGANVGLCENGVMAFGYDITRYIVDGENKIEVMTDNNWVYREQSSNSKWQWNSTNFYANYGGLNKNVRLYITEKVYQTLPLYDNLGTTGVYVYAKDFDIPGHKATICVESQVKNDQWKSADRALEVIIEELDGTRIANFSSDTVNIRLQNMVTLKAEQTVKGLHFWSWGYGYLYRVKTIVGTDTVVTTTGFRKTEFKDGIIYLNDRAMMVHGYAQRTTNEWSGVGMSVPAWMSDYSNDMQVKGGCNLVRWMHVAPWKQDVESCDRVGLPQAMPAGDSEGDVSGRQWEMRSELMRNAIIYNRNNPSIIFYEGGNAGISRDHMKDLVAIRNKYDLYGGRAIGSREMLDIDEAEYGGEMLYVDKSDKKPLWMMEYCRDEGIRLYWNSWSYPFHKEGDGPLYYNYIKTDKETDIMSRPEKDTTLNEGLAYLHIRKGDKTRNTLKLIFEDDESPNGIDTITVGNTIKSPFYYGLDGRRTTTPAKGVYIRNGRKIIIK